MFSFGVKKPFENCGIHPLLRNKQAYINGQLKVFRLLVKKKKLKKPHSTAAKEKKQCFYSTMQVHFPKLICQVEWPHNSWVRLHFPWCSFWVWRLLTTSWVGFGGLHPARLENHKKESHDWTLVVEEVKIWHREPRRLVLACSRAGGEASCKTLWRKNGTKIVWEEVLKETYSVNVGFIDTTKRHEGRCRYLTQTSLCA